MYTLQSDTSSTQKECFINLAVQIVMWLISCHLGGNEPSNIGRWEQAVEANAAVMTDPIISSSRWTADMIGNRMDLTREQLPEDVFQAAEQRGREGDLFTALGKLSTRN